MDTNIVAAFIGVAAGAAGYWVTTFWMRPLLQYRELRMKVHADFIFYAQVVNAAGLNERMQNLYEDRVLANRRNSAELVACLGELPSWYKKRLVRQGQAPVSAARHLIGYSNTTEYEAAAKLAAAIKRELGIQGEVE
jgi:hypothetical protein